MDGRFWDGQEDVGNQFGGNIWFLTVLKFQKEFMMQSSNFKYFKQILISLTKLHDSHE
jgi:hypothetical protein